MRCTNRARRSARRRSDLCSVNEQCHRATAFGRAHGTSPSGGRRRAIPVAKRRAEVTGRVGDFRLLAPATSDTEIARRGGQTAMPYLPG
jgi:hypothetical protein